MVTISLFNFKKERERGRERGGGDRERIKGEGWTDGDRESVTRMEG